MDFLIVRTFFLVIFTLRGGGRGFTTEPNHDSAWGSLGNKTYLFVMDVGRRQDLNYYEAKQRCIQSGTSGLVTVDTDEEFEYLKREIQRRVVTSGQEFAHEQWWTAGMAATSVDKFDLEDGDSKEGKSVKNRKNSTWIMKKSSKKLIADDKTVQSTIPWVWDSPGYPTVNVSALKRRTLPKKGVQYLAISHGHGLEGWRLRSLPGNYRLRYICQKYTPPSSQKSEIPMEPLSVQKRPSVNITVNLNFTQFISFNEVKHILCSKIKILLRWNDTNTRTNDTPTTNQSAVDFWLPHVEFQNSLSTMGSSPLSSSSSSSSSSLPEDKVRFLDVQVNSEMEYIHEMCTHCVGDGFLFPYDRYVCFFRLVASNSAFIQSKSSFTAKEAAIQWSNHLCLSEDSSEAKKFKSSKNYDNDSRHDLEFRLEFRRHLTFYALVLLGPTGLVTLPLIFLLKLPVEKCIKIPSIVVLISVFTLQIQFICTLSPKSQRFVVPLIVFYPIAMLTISVISVPINIAFYRSRNHTSPGIISNKTYRSKYLGCCCCYCCVGKKKQMEDLKTSIENKASSGAVNDASKIIENVERGDKEVPFSLTVSRQPSSLLVAMQTVDKNPTYDRRPFYASCTLGNPTTSNHSDLRRIEYRKMFHQTLPSRGSSQKFETNFIDSCTTRSTDSSLPETSSQRQASRSTDELFSAFEVKPRSVKTLILNRNVYVARNNALANKQNKIISDVSLNNISDKTQQQHVTKSSRKCCKTASCVDNFLVSLVLSCFISYIILIAYGWLL